MVSLELPYPDDTAGFFSTLARDARDPVWLDSAGGFGRYSLFAADPRCTLVATGKVVLRSEEKGAATRLRLDPLQALQQELDVGSARGPTPFAGGAIGWFGYDLGAAMAGVADTRPPVVPDMAVGLYDWVVVCDHRTRKCWLAGPDATPARARWLRELVDAVPAPGRYRCGTVDVDLDYTTYARAFSRVHDYLRDGDCYQVNLARRFSVPFDGDGLAAYRRLRRASPAGYCAYLRLAGTEVLSVSPERFLTVRDGLVQTRPIKGTRPRASDPDTDRQLLDDLRASPKDRAENLMIVDLLRNDLGRVCRNDSVRVPELFAAESYATVHHLVSTVTGELRPGLRQVDLLRAALPGGSVTGAPKRRAMEIIRELEPSRRGVYCGAIGYLGYNGCMDTSIAIRTAVRRGSRLEYRAGGGLVWDSRCDGEFDETAAKASAFLDLATSAGGS